MFFTSVSARFKLADLASLQVLARGGLWFFRTAAYFK